MKKIVWLAIMAAPLGAFAWNTSGHMVVSQIAYDNLSDTAKTAVEQIAQMMSAQNFYDGYIHGPQQYQTYLDIAHWPDDLKSQNYNFSSPWHFQDNAWSGDGTPVPPQMVTPSDENVVWAIGEAVMVLSQTVTTQQGLPTVSAPVLSTSLSYLIHFAGDAHQPLHCSTRVTADFTTGDIGGNDYLVSASPADPHCRPGVSGVCSYNGVTFKYPITELHALWDDALGLYPGISTQYDPTQTLTADQVKAVALRIQQDYPLTSAQIAPNVCFANDTTKYKYLSQWAQAWAQTWCKESEGIAQTIYPAIKSPGGITTAYMQTNSSTAELRLALAGYRLAVVLNALFDPTKPAPTYC